MPTVWQSLFEFRLLISACKEILHLFSSVWYRCSRRVLASLIFKYFLLPPSPITHKIQRTRFSLSCLKCFVFPLGLFESIPHSNSNTYFMFYVTNCRHVWRSCDVDVNWLCVSNETPLSLGNSSASPTTCHPINNTTWNIARTIIETTRFVREAQSHLEHHIGMASKQSVMRWCAPPEERV